MLVVWIKETKNARIAIDTLLLLGQNMHSKKNNIAICLYCCLLLGVSTPGLNAQNLSSFSNEKMPETKDPRYLPPLFSTKISLGQDASDAAFLFGSTDNLAEYLSNQKEKATRKRLESGRFVERETRRMLAGGHQVELLEQQLLEQYGKNSFAANAGTYPYTESSSRRFTVVFLLALPITGGLSFGTVSLASGNGSSTFSGQENLLAGGIALASALAVAWYDHRRLTALLHNESSKEEWPPEIRLRDGFLPQPGNQQHVKPDQSSHAYPLFKVDFRL